MDAEKPFSKSGEAEDDTRSPVIPAIYARPRDRYDAHSRSYTSGEIPTISALTLSLTLREFCFSTRSNKDEQLFRREESVACLVPW